MLQIGGRGLVLGVMEAMNAAGLVFAPMSSTVKEMAESPVVVFNGNVGMEKRIDRRTPGALGSFYWACEPRRAFFWEKTLTECFFRISFWFLGIRDHTFPTIRVIIHVNNGRVVAVGGRTSDYEQHRGMLLDRSGVAFG